ncbi:MAG TPA: hypothetical protein VLV89_02860 [Candidatus Acidoferrum sp.]|nr:hypothetical protein [Candidatus Acidoferrum sp.]
MRKAIIVLCGLLALLGLCWILLQHYATSARPHTAVSPIIEKQAAVVTRNTFDPTAPPPADMPPMSPGELAVCDSNFTAKADVVGESQESDSTHATLTITGVKMTLGLTVAIWTPEGATDHVIEHEDGHRQISEYYYETADKLAAQIAAKYIGRRVPVEGTDLHAEITKTLQQLGAEITDEYDKELNPETTQLRYDAITDHARNDVSAKDAVAQAIRETATTPIQ